MNAQESLFGPVPASSPVPARRRRVTPATALVLRALAGREMSLVELWEATGLDLDHLVALLRAHQFRLWRNTTDGRGHIDLARGEPHYTLMPLGRDLLAEIEQEPT